MKKVLAIVLTLCMALSLCACGASSSTSSTPAASAPAASTAAPAEAAPEAKTYTVGICQLVQHDALDAATKGFQDALTEKLGDSVKFDLQNAQGDSTTCSTIVTGFVSNSYDLIMANATPALQAAVSATNTIPIMGTSVTDYASALSIAGMDATKGTGINVSGTSDGVPGSLYADLTMQVVPDAKKVAVLFCSAEANSEIQSDDFIAAMNAKDPSVTCTVYKFNDSNDMQSVVTTAASENDVIYIPTDNTAASNMTIVSNVCQPLGMPVICGEENMMMAGGLATVSISYYNIGHVCGEMAYEVLVNGADVSTMAIKYADAPELKYNADFASAIDCKFDFAGNGFAAG